MGNSLRKLWNDPVWSKVIATGIIATISIFSVMIWSHISSLSQPMQYLLIGIIAVTSFIILYLIVRILNPRQSKLLIFLSSGGTCRDPMAKVITSKLLEKRKLKYPLKIIAAGLGPLSDYNASYAARYVIKDMYNEDLLANHKPVLLSKELAEKADLILAMDKSLLLTPGKNLPIEKTVVLREFFGETGNIVDPWPDGKDTATLNRYRECANELKNIISPNIDHLVEVLDV